ncbi:MAG: PAS domain-containing protein [Methanospirillum sp.]|nr:PAS domain-containing protein [Methanospirillum sp.]
MFPSPTLPLLVSALLTALLAAYAWRHRASGAATGYVALLLGAISLYVGGSAMELAAGDLEGVLFWARVQYLGIAVVPPLIICTVLQYVGQGRILTRRVLVILFAVPAITLLLVVAGHPLHYAEIGFDTVGAFSRFTFVPGPWYYVNALYVLIAEMAAVALLALSYLRSSHALYRQQILVVLVGASFPIAASLLYLTGFSPIPRLDLTPFALPITAAVMTIGVVLYQLFDLAPVAHTTVFERIPIGVLVVTDLGQVVEANPAAVQLLGPERRSPVGRPLEEVTREIPDLSAIVASGKTGETEVHDRGRRGTYAISTVPLTDAGSAPGGSVVLIRDVTASRRAEAALARRTADLETANRRLSLVSTITRHDIANHLVAVMGYLSLLRDDPAGPDVHGYVERLQEAVDRIRAVIEFMRDYPAIGVQPPVWLDLREVADRAGASVGLSGAVVENLVPPLDVLADPLLERVFAALVENSVRHGGGVSWIRFAAVSSGPGILLTIEDDGAGIPRPDKERIFERGFGRNTGLGLFLAREILESMGMTIAETGIPGHGARFEIRVPPARVRRCAVSSPEGIGALALHRP